MKILNQIDDHRINSKNLLIETTLGEYNDLASVILKENEFQRKRVKASATVYSLLKSDLRSGCVIPPVVLALAVDLKLKGDEKEVDLTKLIEQNKQKLIILDGLQRTYTIRDLIKEAEDKSDPELKAIKKLPLRMEIYLGINKLGILYRMLTLNTGQTPMSSRHQIEIIYSDYIKEGSLKGIKLLKQVDGESPNRLGEYNFRDIIDGFTSYLERDYLTIERLDILDNIKSLEKLSSENQNKDLFVQFVNLFHDFVAKMDELAGDWEFDADELDKTLGGPPFARKTLKTFNKSQVMSGFGSAIGKLVDLKAISSLDEVKKLIQKIKVEDSTEDMNSLILKLDDIRSKAKKIGNDQRLFFHYLFRELFDKESEAYLDFDVAIKEGYSQYERKTQ